MTTKTLLFGANECIVGPGWVVTILPDGRTVHAHPQNNAKQAETAERLGYGADVVTMTQQHDPLHTALATWPGLPASISLRRAVGDQLNPTHAALEEEAVIAVQRYCRAIGCWPW